MDDDIFMIRKSLGVFHTPDGIPHATVNLNGHQEIMPIRDSKFELYLQHEYWKRCSEALGSVELKSIIESTAAKALFDGDVCEVFTRIAHSQGNIYVDLCDDLWRVVEITKTGWNILEESPVRFVRARNAESLPVPVNGGSIDVLRQCVNADDDYNWTLIIAWVLSTLQPEGAYPILVLQGEQDSGKSATSRTLRRVIDPTAEQIRRLPWKQQDIMIAAKNNHILAFDNLSGVSNIMSDVLCTLATGIGSGARQLYTDSSEVILKAKKPIILNGIDEIARRPDLLNRSIILHLPPIAGRKTEREMEAQFIRVWPAVLGAIFDIACIGLRNFGSVLTSDLPRMADFSQWIIACESAAPWNEGDFLSAYRESQIMAEMRQLDLDPVADVLKRFISKQECDNGIYFKGMPTQLFNLLRCFDDQFLLPKTANWLMNKLSRLNPVIRRGWGIEVVSLEEERSKDNRVVVVRKVT